VSRVSASPVASPLSGDLARLLETEQRLEGRLTEERAEAEALVAHARADAAVREAALEAELGAEERRLDEALEAERRRREVEIAAAAQRDAETYQRVPAARLAAVARALAERFLVGEGAA
jgi:hypothetical protein